MHLQLAARFVVAAALAALPPSAAMAQTWTALGPEGGFVAVLAVAPSAPATVYAGTLGGLFQSFDRGRSWTLVSPGLSSPDGITNIAPADLAIRPGHPSTLFAAALSGGLDRTAGVFRSRDRGATWQGVGFYGRSVLCLALGAPGTETVYAGTDGAVYKSEDDGESWSERGAGLVVDGAPRFLVTALAVDAADPSTVYAGTEPFSLFKSGDGGDTWTSLNPSLPSFLPPHGGAVNEIVIDPADHDRVYILANNSGVYRTTDAGATWRRALRLKAVQSLAIHPAGGALYAGGDGLFRSDDRGRAWRSVGEGLPRFFQVRSLALDPTNAFVYAGDGQGLGVAVAPDAGAAWKTRRRGMNATIVYAVAREGSTLYASTNRGIHKTADGGRTWRRADAGLGAGFAFALAIDPERPATLYAGTFAGVYRSRDRGRSWKAMPAGPEGYVRALAIDPSWPAAVYAGVQDFDSLGGVYKSTDRGRSWSRGIDGLTDRYVAVLAVADSSTVYAGTNGGGGVFKSTDGGATWSARNEGLPTSAPLFAVLALAVDPTAPSTLYAGVFREGIYKTVDGGETWLPVNVGITDSDVRALAVDPSDTSVVYAGTYYHGVFRSTDAGASWHRFNAGLPQHRISTLAVGGDGVAVAGTEGGGVYRIATRP